MEMRTEFDMKLYNSSLHGDLEGVMAALTQGGCVAMRNQQGGTPLLAAAHSGHTNICGLLLENGSDVNVRIPEGFTPLLAAAQSGHTDVCGLLLAYGSDVNEMVTNTKHTALHNAVIRGHEASVKVLLSWGATVDPQNHIGSTPLHSACQEGHLPCVLALLKAGASGTLPNTRGQIAIHIAARANKVEVVRTLLEYGCQPDMVRYDDEIMRENNITR